MTLKDSARKCVCKECGKEIKMFMNNDGKLIYFPMNTVRPADGFFELSGHLRHFHKELYGMLILSAEKKNAILAEYNILKANERVDAWSI